MKELKYLQLFEAFESVKLSKTLGFIKKDARTNFITQLKNIASRIDFPISKYSDDYFQYLPFKKALDLNMTIEDTPCDATSVESFEGYGIEGETCQGGRVKRKWGSNVRNVVCPVCNGTGVKPKKYNDLKWIKFWFDKDGKSIAVTGTDGKIRSQIGSISVSGIPNFSHITSTSQELGDYNEITSIRSSSDFLNYPTGTFIYARIDNKNVIGRLFIEDRKGFLIQNRADGGKPDNTNDWMKYGRYSWNVTSGDYSGLPKVLILKDYKEEDFVEETVDPYTWNAPLNVRNLSLENSSDVKSKLSDAHFALVLDFLELKKSGFKTKTEISSERDERKEGSLKLKSDEEIRRENLNRYMEELAKKINITSDLSNMNNLVFRFFGLGKFGYYVLRGRHFGDFDSLLSYLFRFLSEQDKEYYYNKIIDYIVNKSKVNTSFNTEVERVLRETSLELSENRKKLIKKLEEINQVIYNRFKTFKIETIDDLELFHSKQEALRDIWRNSDRFQYLRKLYYAVEQLSDDYRFKRYINEIDDHQIDTVLHECDRFIRIVSKI